MRLSAWVPRLVLALVATAVTRGAPAMPVRPVVPLQTRAFDLAEVRLTDGPFRRAEELNRAYLLSLDPDRFLQPFLVAAGLTTTALPYGGWEAADWDFPGHTLGHYLSACAAMAAHGGEPEFQRRVDHIVTELARCQNALAARAEYPGYLHPQPEAVFARLERQPGGAGVPYYTMHKTIAGLLDAHTLAGSAAALAVARGIADWIAARLDRLSDAQVQAMLRVEHGGMNDVLAQLAALTGERRYLRLAERFNHELLFGPLARGEDPLGPDAGVAGTRLLHANTQIPKAIGAARQHELTGEDRFRAVALNFWASVAGERSFVIGGNSETERFYAKGDEHRHLTARTAEGCNTYNMIKLTRRLFAWSPSAAYMDFHERALYNHLLAAQNPHNGMNTYFMSLEPGGRKRFATPEHTFWCCTGTGMEIHATHGAAIYDRDPDGIRVNLFIASEVRWRERGVVLQQLTEFPDSDRTTLVIRTNQPQRFVVRLRVPGWADAAELRVNGTSEPLEARPGSYATIERRWSDGDRIEWRLRTRVRAAPLPGDPSLAAFTYGPIVLVGRVERADRRFLPSVFVDNGKSLIGPRPAEDPVPVPPLIGHPDEIASKVERTADRGLQFVLRGASPAGDLTWVPLHRIVDESYTVYWRCRDRATAAAAWQDAQPARDRLASRSRLTSDVIWFGDPRSEAVHALVDVQAPVVSSRLSLYREASDGRVGGK